ncbi:uncharacterized protein LOC144099426 [Amblyomma americanum]
MTRNPGSTYKGLSHHQQGSAVRASAFLTDPEYAETRFETAGPEESGSLSASAPQLALKMTLQCTPRTSAIYHKFLSMWPHQPTPAVMWSMASMPTVLQQNSRTLHHRWERLKPHW